MSSIRPPGSQLGGPAANHVRGSMFDDTAKTRQVRLPSGLDAIVRRIVKQVLADNPHLHDPGHLPAVIRLAEHRHLHERLVEELRGAELVDGDGKANPLIAHAARVAGVISTDERLLGIAVTARAQHVPKSAQQRPPAPVAKKAGDVKARVVRIA